MPTQRPHENPRNGKAKRRYGTGSVFEKRNAWYGQWRVRDRLITRKLGPVRGPGSREGLTRTMAEARLRHLMSEVAPPPVPDRVTVADAGERLLRQLTTRGRKPSTLAAYRTHLRVHLSPHFGETPLARIDKDDATPSSCCCGSRAASSSRAVEHRLAIHLHSAAIDCPSIAVKHVTMHTLRHTAAMRLLLAGNDITTIALWLGHEQISTTNIYLHADTTHKQQAIDRTRPLAAKPGRYRPTDSLLAFLEAL